MACNPVVLFTYDPTATNLSTPYGVLYRKIYHTLNGEVGKAVLPHYDENKGVMAWEDFIREQNPSFIVHDARELCSSLLNAGRWDAQDVANELNALLFEHYRERSQGLAVPSRLRQECRVLGDKKDLYYVLKEAGIPTPEIREADCYDPEFPVLKKRCSCQGREVYLVDSAQAFVNIVGQDNNEYIAQRRIRPFTEIGFNPPFSSVIRVFTFGYGKNIVRAGISYNKTNSDFRSNSAERGFVAIDQTYDWSTATNLERRMFKTITDVIEQKTPFIERMLGDVSKIGEFSSAQGNWFVGIDFLVTGGGEYFCIDCNPRPGGLMSNRTFLMNRGLDIFLRKIVASCRPQT